jgi:ferredoxin-NADP reductase
MQVTFERREEIAPAIWEYFFMPERPVDYVAGQYAEFRLPEPLVDPRGRNRTFTLTSVPTDPFISFVAKFVAPLSPYKQALQALQPGQEAHIGDTMGDLVLPKMATMPLVFVAGGIGMASFASVFKELLAKRETREIYMFYRLRSRREQIYRELTKSYPLGLNTLAIAPNQFTAEDIVASTPPGALLFLSGSQSFVEALRIGLAEQGVSHDRIVFDYYDGYADL